MPVNVGQTVASLSSGPSSSSARVLPLYPGETAAACGYTLYLLLSASAWEQICASGFSADCQAVQACPVCCASQLANGRQCCRDASLSCSSLDRGGMKPFKAKGLCCCVSGPQSSSDSVQHAFHHSQSCYHGACLHHRCQVRIPPQPSPPPSARLA